MNIYMLGICGTGMGNLAIMLKALGHNVEGVDTNIYPPMSTQLEQANITVLQGYSEDNIRTRKVDLVIIGNVIRRDNPEAQYVVKESLDYVSMAEAINMFFMKDKERLVVAGTHGKTTTAFMLATALDALGENPGFFVGGIPKNFENMGRSTDSEYFVIEGDEYDTAFFDKKAKFLNYKPKNLIITSIEFDHADIYNSLDAILDAFRELVESIPENGIIVYNMDDKNLNKLIKSSDIKAKLLSYGATNAADYYCHKVHMSTVDEKFLSFYIGEQAVKLRIPGKHNVLNSVAVFALLSELGFESNDISQAIYAFKGVRRRQDIIYTVNGITVIDDFAHHPTAVALTIEAIKEWFPNQRLWAIFEPRTATTRTNKIETALISSLREADRVVLAPVHQPERVIEVERLKPSRVVNILNKEGTVAYAPNNVDAIVDLLVKELRVQDVVLIMSNGGFGGIYDKLKDALSGVFNGVFENRG